jgi:hypothetical protein
LPLLLGQLGEGADAEAACAACWRTPRRPTPADIMSWELVAYDTQPVPVGR